MRALLCKLAALVLFVTAFTSNAGAQTMKQYAALQALKKITDRQMYDWFISIDPVNESPVYSQSVGDSSATASNVTFGKSWIKTFYNVSEQTSRYANEMYTSFILDRNKYHEPVFAIMENDGTPQEFAKCFTIYGDDREYMSFANGHSRPNAYGDSFYAWEHRLVFPTGNNVVSRSYGIKNDSGPLNAAFDSDKSRCFSLGPMYKWIAFATFSIGNPEGYGPYIRKFLSDYIMEPDPMKQQMVWQDLQVTGVFNSDAACTVEACPEMSTGGTPGTGGTGGGTGGGTTTNNTTVECTTPDGTKTTSQVLCAPSDTDTKCSIIDIPCNFKKAFIPSKDFVKVDLFNTFAEKFHIPIQAVNSIQVTTNNAYLKDVKLDFSFMTSPEVQNILRLIAYFQVLSWITSYLGIPNPFKATRGDSYAGDRLKEDVQHINNSIDNSISGWKHDN